tara:strand:- start:805 stop:2700 length:1896 start_codon:yes stop_codon:yes gene_type:complete
MAAGINTKGKMQITELDFDGIKSNLKTYLKGQSNFTDYDFEGSGMNILLDTLAYNTHYNAFLANMLANEMFLDTAQKRNSVTSHAKALGYTTVSERAPIAYVKVQVNDASTPNITMPEGYAFTTTINGVSYQFVNTTERIIQPDAGIYVFGPTDGIPVYEGTWTTTRFTVDLSDADQKFIIPNAGVDISSIQVQVQTSAGDTTTTTYTKATSLVDITSTTTAFFCQETTDAEWEIYFGDGVIGQALVDGNIVILKYVITNGAEANGAVTFTASGVISGFNDITTTTILAAAGGADMETLDSIKYNAPFSYAAQNRTVTAKDYAAIVPTIYPNVESISVWGGEYADPAVYGKVFISIRPKAGNTLTESTKTSIVTSLEDYNVASVTPVILDPETTKIVPTVNFKFNNTLTSKSKEDLAALITTKIGTFSDDNLEKHEAIFRYSPFVTMVDEVDPSILSNITTIKMSKTFLPTLGTGTQYTIAFENPIYNPHSGHAASTSGTTSGGVISSSGFKYTGDTNVYYYEDDGSGNVKSFYVSGTTKVYKAAVVGTVTYTTGKVILTKEDIASVENYDGATQKQIRITVQPDSNDLVPVRNQVLEIDTYNLSVTGTADTVSAGSSDGGTQYSTSSSYN